MTQYEALLNRIRTINADVAIRPADTSDATAYTTLMNNQYQRKKTEDYFRWQFIDPVIPVRLFVAYCRSTLVGCYGVQIHSLSNGKYCGFAVDLLIAPEFRNKGLFVLLEHEVTRFCISQQCVAVTLLPNPFGMKAHAGLEGWRVIGSVQTLELASIHDQQVFIQLGAYRERTFVSFAKNGTYRHWRYDKHPSYSYSYNHLASGEFAVMKVFEDPVSGNRFGDVVDFTCDLNDVHKLKYLFYSACNQLKEEKVESVTTWALPHSNVFRVVSQLGFRPLKQERYFCVKVLQAGYEYLYDIASWHLVQSDSEIF